MSYISLMNSRWRCSYILLSWKRQTHRSNSLGGRDSEREREKGGGEISAMRAALFFSSLRLAESSTSRQQVCAEALSGCFHHAPTTPAHESGFQSAGKSRLACGFRVVSTLR